MALLQKPSFRRPVPAETLSAVEGEVEGPGVESSLLTLRRLPTWECCRERLAAAFWSRDPHKVVKGTLDPPVTPPIVPSSPLGLRMTKEWRGGWGGGRRRPSWRTARGGRVLLRCAA